MKPETCFPIFLFRQGWLGGILEFLLIGVLLVIYLYGIAFQADLYPRLAAPFQHDDAYQAMSMVGIGFWVVPYIFIVAPLKILECNCCNTTPDRNQRAWVSCANILYHLVRWPILLGMAAADDVLVMTIGYCLDGIVLILFALVLLTIWSVRYCRKQGCGCFAREIANIRLDVAKARVSPEDTSSASPEE